MKLTKICITAIAVITALSLTSCSVEYRTRHPRPVRHRHVIVVGMAKPTLPVDSSVTKLVQQMSKTYILNDNKSK
jgi:hypothetical protein